MIDDYGLNISISTSVKSSLIIDDTIGAMMYLVVVILWYSISIVFLLGMNILPHYVEIEDSGRRRTRFAIRNFRHRTNTKEILEELVDKEKRDRLWDIYLGATSGTKDDLVRAETIRIRLIKKQLESIKRKHRSKRDTFSSSINVIPYIRSRSHYRPESSPLTSILRRRSSFDQ